MDPLSVSASIIGILGAAANVSSVLVTFVQRTRAAPRLAHSVLREVESLSAVLNALQDFLLGNAVATKSGASLILIEQVLVVLTECVTAFSELEEVLGTAKEDNDLGVLERIKWAMKDSKIVDIQARLEKNKSSLTLMLTILQCTSPSEALDPVARLCGLVEQVLKSNQDMSQRLRAMEDRHDPVITPSTPSNHEEASTTPSRPQTPPVALGTQGVPHDQVGFAFEEDLLSSQVYRKPLFSKSGESLITSAARSTTASVLSALSVADVTDISSLAVPIYAHEISNSRRYSFGDFTPPTTSSSVPQQNYQRSKSTIRSFTAVLLRRPKRKSEDAESTSTPKHTVLGVPLVETIKFANIAISLTNANAESFIYGYVPIWVAKTGVFLKERATEVEDIFHVSGSPVRMKQLEAAFDSQPRYGKNIDWTGYTVHDAAAILLRFLYRLPESVIVPESYDKFRQPFLRSSSLSDKGRVVMKSDERQLISVYQELVAELPALSRQLLLYLLDILAVFASKCELNKMTSARLSAIFQPGILSPIKQGDGFIEEEHSRRLSQDVLIFLIEQQDSLLISVKTQP